VSRCWALLLILLGAFILLFIGVLILHPLYVEVCEGSQHDAKQKCESYHLLLATLLKIGRIFAHAETWTALATISAPSADLQGPVRKLPPGRRRGIRKERARPHHLRGPDEGHQVRCDGRSPRSGEQQPDLAARLARLPRATHAARQEEAVDLRQKRHSRVDSRGRQEQLNGAAATHRVDQLLDLPHPGPAAAVPYPTNSTLSEILHGRR
jgi:hypothetical protein